MHPAPTWLVMSGLVLLAVGALSGFAQARFSKDPERAGRWRVVHTGGTAGAVQLLALAGIWHQLPPAFGLATPITMGIAISSWLFFVDPLAKAVGHEKLGAWLNLVGAFIAGPSYVGVLGLVPLP